MEGLDQKVKSALRDHAKRVWRTDKYISHLLETAGLICDAYTHIPTAISFKNTITGRYVFAELSSELVADTASEQVGVELENIVRLLILVGRLPQPEYRIKELACPMCRTAYWYIQTFMSAEAPDEVSQEQFYDPSNQTFRLCCVMCFTPYDLDLARTASAPVCICSSF